jgi:hypothetical protein
MALTQEAVPETYTPAYNECVFVYSSTNSGQTNFRYKIEVYQGLSVIATFNVFPDTDGYGIVDVHRIVESYVTQDVEVDDDGFKTNDNSYIQFNLVITEVYGDPLADDDTDTTSAFYAFNGSLSYNSFASYDEDDYLMTASSGTVSFLTNQPRTVTIGDDENAWLYMFQEATGGGAASVIYMRINTYDSDGSLIDTYQVDNTFTPIGASEERLFLRFPTGTRNLNLITSNFTTGSAPIIDSTVKSYKIYAENSSSNQISEEFTYNVDDQCSVNEKVRITFLNALGGFDSFTFTGSIRETNEIERKDYLNKTSSFSGGSYGYDLATHRKKDYYVSNQVTGTLTTRYLTDAEAVWLGELSNSPLVYIDAGDALIACNVAMNNYDVLRTANREPMNISFDFWFSKNVRQR